MYTCICGGSYKLPQVVDTIIGLVTENNPVVRVTIICPHCKTKGIKGGEHIHDEFGMENGKIEVRDAIMMFGADYDEKTDKEHILKINNDGSLLVKNPTFEGIKFDEKYTYNHVIAAKK